jgi:hypothetical protein
MKYFLFILFLSVAHATSNFDKTEYKLTETLDISKHKLVKKYMSHRPVEYYLRHPRLYHGIKWDYINTKSALKRFHGVTHTHSIILECSHQYTHCEKWVGPKLEAKFRVQHVKPMLGCGDEPEPCVKECVDRSIEACTPYDINGVATPRPFCDLLDGGREINQTKCEAPASTWNGTACTNTDYTNEVGCITVGTWEDKPGQVFCVSG